MDRCDATVTVAWSAASAERSGQLGRVWRGAPAQVSKQRSEEATTVSNTFRRPDATRSTSLTLPHDGFLSVSTWTRDTRVFLRDDQKKTINNEATKIVSISQ